MGSSPGCSRDRKFVYRSLPFVHRLSSSTPCPARLPTHFPHKPFPLHRLVCVLCGSRGKLCPPYPLTVGISKSPQLHSLVLENQPPRQLSLYKQFHLSFHFSSHNYGYCCLFSLSLLPFPPPRRDAIPKRQNRPWHLPTGSASRALPLITPIARESRKAPLFSTPTQTPR